jgi:hypothetical protein
MCAETSPSPEELSGQTLPDIHLNVRQLIDGHGHLRAEDWISPLVRQLLGEDDYRDGGRTMCDSYRGRDGVTREGQLHLAWAGLKEDFDKCLRTYQIPVITEFATLGLSCILIRNRAGLRISEVTRRGERADYWLGEKRYLVEIAGLAEGDIESLCLQKASQLLSNPFRKDGFVCVAVYAASQARLWFFQQSESK